MSSATPAGRRSRFVRGENGKLVIDKSIGGDDGGRGRDDADFAAGRRRSLSLNAQSKSGKAPERSNRGVLSGAIDNTRLTGATSVQEILSAVGKEPRALNAVNVSTARVGTFRTLFLCVKTQPFDEGIRVTNLTPLHRGV
jgi:hypothetical protein